MKFATSRRTTAAAVLGATGLMIAVLLTTTGAGSADTGRAPSMPMPMPTTTVAGPTTTNPPPPPPTTPPTTPGATKKSINYGPYTIPGVANPTTGGHGQSMTGNQFSLFIQKPCGDCYLTSMDASLIYGDGTVANVNTRAELHHAVLFDSAFGRSDNTCALNGVGLLGQRFFASGNERTKMVLPNGYGYYVGSLDSWHMIWDLAGSSTADQSVYIQMNYSFVSASTPGMKKAQPVWLDVNQCGNSLYTAPAGPSDKHYTWNVNVPGKVLGMGGHQHDGGSYIDIKNDTTAKTLCHSAASYGQTPAYIDHHGMPHLSSMSTCYFDPTTAPVVKSGEKVTIHSNYNLAAESSDVMGIVVMWVAP